MRVQEPFDGRLDAKVPPRTYGRELAANFGGDEAPFMISRTLRQAQVAVTELRVQRPSGRLSDPIPREDGYMISVMLSDLPRNEYWEDGRQVSRYSLQTGATTIHDLKREPLAVIDKPLHSLQWYIPRATFNALADQAGAPYISDLRHQPGVGIFDETINEISRALLPALQTPERVSRLFADYVMLAFAAHVAEAYGGMQTAVRLVKGGLAPWQERRSKEMLAADLTGDTPLSVIADACGLSVGHFSRAFRRSTGLAPHAWLLQARVDTAMTLLNRPDASLASVALACGFADQSHFTRAFTRRVGVSPGAWRRITRN